MVTQHAFLFFWAWPAATDKALQQAKAAGRNHVVQAGVSMLEGRD